MSQKILIVDDEKPTRDAMARILSKDYIPITAPDADLALRELDANLDICLLITDYKMPGKNGIDLIREAKAKYPNLAAIIITAFGEIELAVEAMKSGADDFLTKPILDIEKLEFRIAKAINHAPKSDGDDNQLPAGETVKSSSAKKKFDLEDFTGRSEAMKKVYRLIEKAAKSNATVLLEGESGTGKELAAKALHSLSLRNDKPFVAVECASLSPSLLESELFGHEKGAFTDAVQQKIGLFEAANGGTLFLDEITEIDLATQVKLLRVLETRKFQRVGGTQEIGTDFRLIAATNRNIAEYVAQGKFREDLFYRLDVIEIDLPPLRERKGDIRLLAARFAKEAAKKNNLQHKAISADAMKMLERYEWPGNVRQLRNAIERMVVLSSGDELSVDDIPSQITQKDSSPLNGYSLTMEEQEKNTILKALEQADGNRSQAARALNISRRTLQRRLADWGM